MTPSPFPTLHSPALRPQLGTEEEEADGCPGVRRAPPFKAMFAPNLFLSGFIIRSWADGSGMSLTLLLLVFPKKRRQSGIGVMCPLMGTKQNVPQLQLWVNPHPFPLEQESVALSDIFIRSSLELHLAYSEEGATTDSLSPMGCETPCVPTSRLRG